MPTKINTLPNHVDYKHRYEELSGKWEELESDSGDIRNRFADMERDNVALQAQKDSLEAKLKLAEENGAKKEKASIDASSSLAALEGENKKLKMQALALQRDVDRLQEAVADRDRLLISRDKDDKDARIQIEDLYSQLAAAQVSTCLHQPLNHLQNLCKKSNTYVQRVFHQLNIAYASTTTVHPSIYHLLFQWQAELKVGNQTSREGRMSAQKESAEASVSQQFIERICIPFQQSHERCLFYDRRRDGEVVRPRRLQVSK